MQVSPYLFLYGRCEEAIDFYLQATGGELLSKMKFGDMPDQGEQVGDQSAAPQPPEKIMHAQLRIGDGELMLSVATPISRQRLSMPVTRSVSQLPMSKRVKPGLRNCRQAAR